MRNAQISIVAKIINPWLFPFAITRSSDNLSTANVKGEHRLFWSPVDPKAQAASTLRT